MQHSHVGSVRSDNGVKDHEGEVCFRSCRKVVHELKEAAQQIPPRANDMTHQRLGAREMLSEDDRATVLGVRDEQLSGRKKKEGVGKGGRQAEERSREQVPLDMIGTTQHNRRNRNDSGQF